MTDKQIQWAILGWQGGSSVISKVNKQALDNAGIEIMDTAGGTLWRRPGGKWKEYILPNEALGYPNDQQ